MGRRQAVTQAGSSCGPSGPGGPGGLATPLASLPPPGQVPFSVPPLSPAAHVPWRQQTHLVAQVAPH